MTEEGCIICGEDLVYRENTSEMTCSVCGESMPSNADCVNGHFVCDRCHSSDANEYIYRFCAASREKNPIALARAIMKNPSVKMHGPEHHYLVPAVLITAYYNTAGEPENIPRKLETARKRAEKVLGGFCGFYGTCGAGVGAGIFLSIVQNATPLSVDEWRYGNLVTARCLEVIAEHGGPRCCKRDTFLALETTIRFLDEHLGIVLDSSEVHCEWSEINRECVEYRCPFYRGE